jgi:hypothetical protein
MDESGSIASFTTRLTEGTGDLRLMAKYTTAQSP